MLPSAASLAEGLRFLARRRDITVPDIAILTSLVSQAEQLAAGCAVDEPAAIFFASARHGSELGAVAQLLIPLLTLRQAAAVGLELHADEVALAVLRLRVVKRAITFAELRDWFSRY